MSLDLGERRAYVRLLAQRIEEENRAFEMLGDRLKGG